MPTVLLIRHGRTTANTSGLLAGWTPGVALDETGAEQVAALAVRLAPLPVARIVTSPLTRCVMTAEALRAAWPQAPVGTEEALGECKYGGWTGRALAELAEDPLWRTVQDHPSAAVFPPSQEYAAESIATMAARSVAAVRRIDAEVAAEHGPTALWVAVSHGDIIKAVLADAAGTHLDLFQRYTVAPASLSVISYTPARPFVVRVNDVGGDVAGLLPPPPHAGAGPAQDAAVGGGA